MIKIFILVILGFPALHSSGQHPQMWSDTQEELNLPLIMERIAKTSPEGLRVIETVKGMKPEIQKYRSAKTLGEAVEYCINGRGKFLIYPVGWEAVKSEGPWWRICFYFKDEEQRYLKATWEYNEDRYVLLPKEFTNATKFWVRSTNSKTIRP